MGPDVSSPAAQSIPADPHQHQQQHRYHHDDEQQQQQQQHDSASTAAPRSYLFDSADTAIHDYEGPFSFHHHPQSPPQPPPLAAIATATAADTNDMAHESSTGPANPYARSSNNTSLAVHAHTNCASVTTVNNNNNNNNNSQQKRQFECLYTKHKTQKRKIWHDGRLVISGIRALLYSADPTPGTGDPRLDQCEITPMQRQCILANPEDHSELESDQFLIQIEGPWVPRNRTTTVATSLSKRRQPNATTTIANGIASTRTSNTRTTQIGLTQTGMKRLLSKKFQKPKAFIPTQESIHTGNNREGRLRSIFANRKRPLQPGELRRMHYRNGRPPQHRPNSGQPQNQTAAAAVQPTEHRTSSNPYRRRQNASAHAPRQQPPEERQTIPNHPQQEDADHSHRFRQFGAQQAVAQQQMQGRRDVEQFAAQPDGTRQDGPRNIPQHQQQQQQQQQQQRPFAKNNANSDGTDEPPQKQSALFTTNDFNENSFYGEEEEEEQDDDDNVGMPFAGGIPLFDTPAGFSMGQPDGVNGVTNNFQPQQHHVSDETQASRDVSGNRQQDAASETTTPQSRPSSINASPPNTQVKRDLMAWFGEAPPP